MKYYRLRPEAPAHNYGDTRDPDNDYIVTSVKLKFEFPLRSELINAVGANVVTAELADALRATDFTGFRFGPVTQVTIADWSEYKDQIVIPALECLIVTGTPAHDDFGLAGRHLIVSEQAARWLVHRDPELRRKTNEVGADTKPIGLYNPMPENTE